MRIGSLFSGIGGLELGLEWSGIGHTIWQVEKDEYCREVLEKHWPGVDQYVDVKAVGVRNLAAVDLICGGFPCQDVSSAGNRAGLAGERSGLWREYARILDECRPEWVVVENVASGATLWVDDVARDLAELGYASLPVPLSASDCGLWHSRARVFIVAHLDPHSQPIECEHAETFPTPPSPERAWFSEPSMVREAYGFSTGLDRRRIEALGNSVVPHCAEVIGWLIRELIIKP